MIIQQLSPTKFAAAYSLQCLRIRRSGVQAKIVADRPRDLCSLVGCLILEVWVQYMSVGCCWLILAWPVHTKSLLPVLTGITQARHVHLIPRSDFAVHILRSSLNTGNILTSLYPTDTRQILNRLTSPQKDGKFGGDVILFSIFLESVPAKRC